MSNPSIIDGNRIFKAQNVSKKSIHPIYLQISESLSHIDAFNYIKIYKDRICASNQLSTDKKKNPVTTMDQQGVIGVELLIDPAISTVQFFSLASSEKGYGRKIVEAVVRATPDDWNLIVTMDWSGGFWDKMLQEYPRIIVF